jgi:Xaa-Pro aminopeptidase
MAFATARTAPASGSVSMRHMPSANSMASLPSLLADQPALWFSIGHDAGWDTRIAAALNKVRAESRAAASVRRRRSATCAPNWMPCAWSRTRMSLTSCAAPRRFPRAPMCAPCALSRRAVSSTKSRPNCCTSFAAAAASIPAYTSIVAGGANACVLHYVGNDQVLKDGDLLLIDAGGELDGYASDITRCFPVNGRFSGPQADVYNLVLAAQAAAIAAVRPGAAFIDPHEAALKALAQGMIDLKLLSGSRDAVIESESYKRFFMHRTSHWLGKDVHDAGEYKRGSTGRRWRRAWC